MNGSPALQHWARRLGIGRADRDRPAGRRGGPAADAGLAQPSSIAKGLTDRPWSAGDNVNLSVGQGDLQADPLQMAVAYAAIANGGTVVRPHVGLQVEDAAGRVRAGDRPRRRRARSRSTPPTAQVDPRRPARRRAGAGRHLLHRLRRLPGPGRRQDRHRRAPRPTADQSWYVVLAPYPEPAGRRRGDRRARAASAPTRRRRPRCDDPLRVLRRAGEAGRQHRGRRSSDADVRDPRPPRPPGAVLDPARDRRAARPALHGPRPAARGARRWPASASSPSPRRRTDDVPGDPYYFVERQAIYAGLGIARDDRC